MLKVLLKEVGGRKLYKLLGLFSKLLILFTLVTSLNGGSFSEFKRSASDSFKNYKDDKDVKFNSYLNSSWEAYSSKKPISLYEKIKPSNISSARHRNIKKIGPITHIKLAVEKQSLEKTTSPTQASESEKESKDFEFDFFGTKLSYNIPAGIQKAKFYPKTQKGISNFFNSVSTSEYESLVDEISVVSNDMNLNDWGKYLLIKEISENIFSDKDDSKLLNWFIFNKLGYALRVGLTNKHVVVMYHSQKLIYSTPSYKIDGKDFYVISDYTLGNSGSLFTYEQNYPESNKAFDLSMSSLPKFKDDVKSKILSFDLKGKKHSIEYRYNQNLIDFMSTYPQADYQTFFSTPMEQRTYNDIKIGLKKYIDNRKASVAINFILNFVQNGFKYEVDQQQFGKEKVMFAQETLYFDKSDCEDRSILFAYLIKKLFSVSVVGVKYKDHMSTGLYIPMDGDSVKLNSKRFVIADPSYMNAIVGQSIPKYKHNKPDSFIVVKKN